MRCRTVVRDVSLCCQGIGTNAESAIALQFVERASGEYRQFLRSFCDDVGISDVHNIHPIHPYLEMRVKPVSRTRSRSEISDDTTDDDNVDEPCQRSHRSASIYAHVLRFDSSQAPWCPMLQVSASSQMLRPILSDVYAVASKTLLARVSTVLIVRWKTSIFASTARLLAYLVIWTRPTAGIVLPISC